MLGKIAIGLCLVCVTTVIQGAFMSTDVRYVEWRVFYLYNPALTAIPDLETALYFSMVTFTSVGYGDVVIAGDWRILASLEGANGVIIFGWTTALIFYVLQHLYRPR
jgi:voltage-gated potassium channel Kch